MIAEKEAADPEFRLEEVLAEIAAQEGVSPDQADYVSVAVGEDQLAMLPFMLMGLGGGGGMSEPDFGPGEFDEPEGFDSPVIEEEVTDCFDDANETESFDGFEVETDGEGPVFVEGDFAEGDFGPGEFDGGPMSFEEPAPPTILIHTIDPIDEAAFVKQKEDRAMEMFGGFAEEDNSLTADDFGMTAEEFEAYQEEEKQFRDEMKKQAEVSRTTHAGKTIYTNSGTSWTFLDANTIVVGGQEQLAAAIDRGGRQVDSQMLTLMQPALEQELAIAINLEPIKGFIEQATAEAPLPVQLIAGPLLQSKYILFTADLQGETLARLSVTAESEQSANNLNTIASPFVEQGITGLKAEIESKLDEGSLSEEEAAAVPLVRALTNGVTTSVEGDVYTISLARPAEIADLPKLLRPQFEAEVAMRKLNVYRMVGLAFHDHESVYSHFPAADSNGGEGDELRGKGLSWRVHILPYLGYYELYDRFNLDEPWDSEQNKALLAEMPIEFGSNEEGKTSLHVFVGEGTMFPGETGLRFRDILDGSSNTILVALAGEDTADFWTKPGGLTIDPANPVAALGNIDEQFVVILADGSLHQLPKDIDGETLKNLINPDDGNPTEIP